MALLKRKRFVISVAVAMTVLFAGAPGSMAIAMASTAPAEAVTADTATVARIDFRPLVEWPATQDQLLNDNTAVTILGPAEVPWDKMVEFIRNRNPEPKISCSLEALVKTYYAEAQKEGIRPDVAICQSLKETAFYKYGGDVHPEQNNYCGLGATGNHNPGFSFATPQLGVRAHIQHLQAYAVDGDPHEELVDPRYEVLCEKYPEYHGAAEYWTDLNGKWAVPGTVYGQSIIHLWQQVKDAGQAQSEFNEQRQGAWAKVQSGDAKAIKEYANMVHEASLRGVYQESLEEYAQLAALNPKVKELYVYRGDFYRDWGKEGLALEEYDKALKLDQSCERALLGKAQQLVIQQEKPQEISKAIECYNKLLSMNPANELALYNRGGLYAAIGERDAAIRDLESAAKLDPDNKIISKLLAKLGK